MTKISKKSSYPIKIPVRKDYFVGSDSENNGKTINFDFESGAKLIGEINGSTALSYKFRTDSNIDLTVLTEGVFLSAENETTIANISKIYINKNNFHETNMSDLFRFVSVNRESFLMKLRNSSNLSNAVYFRITDATEFESYFILDVAVEMNNASLPELINFNVYFFDFELSSSDLAITLPEFNKIVTQTGYTSTETTITFNPAWTWLIKNVSYTNPSSVTKPITPTSAGKKRIDSFVLNTSGTFQVVTGAETIGSPIQELTPIDTLYVTFCIVGDAGIESVEPIDLSNYATIDYVNAKDALLSDRITTLEEVGSGVGDMVLASPQTVSGIKTFLAGKLGLRNIADTVTSFFTNSNTVSRAYTLQDRNGTLADLTDIASVNTNKMNTPNGGIANYLPKFLTGGITMGLSRLWDTGTKFGIGTTKTPNEDLTFGNQTERTIGIEQSPNTVSGRDLIVSAGRTINYVEGTGFQRIFSGLALNFTGITVEPISQNLYISSTSGIFKKTASGAFANEFAGISDFARGLGYDNVGNIYVANAAGGFVKKTISTGVWAYVTATGVTGLPFAIGGNSIGDLYMGTTDGVFKQTGGTGSFVKIFTGDVRVISISPIDNSVYISVASNGGTVYKQTGGVGVFNFIQVLGGYQYNVCCLNSGDVLVSLNDAVYKQTAQQGLFLITTITTTSGLEFLTGDINSSIYAIRDNDDIYFLDNNAVGTPNLDGGTKSERAGTGKGTGKSRWDVWTGQKTASGTNMQTPTKRLEVDELGAFKLLTTHQYANNATAIAAGLEVGSLYWTSTGDLKIVI